MPRFSFEMVERPEDVPSPESSSLQRQATDPIPVPGQDKFGGRFSMSPLKKMPIFNRRMSAPIRVSSSESTSNEPLHSHSPGVGSPPLRSAMKHGTRQSVSSPTPNPESFTTTQRTEPCPNPVLLPTTSETPSSTSEPPVTAASSSESSSDSAKTEGDNPNPSLPSSSANNNIPPLSPSPSGVTSPLSVPGSASGSVKTVGTGLGLPRTETGGSSVAPGYERRVGFDNTDAEETTGGTGVAYSFTLQVKSTGYTRTKEARTFLVATDLEDYSINALDWLLEALVEDGDEVVILRVIEVGSSAHSLWKTSQEDAREEAHEVLMNVMEKNGDQRSLSIIAEFVIGKVQSTIQRMIEIYRPDSLVVGTRGRSESIWKTAFMGSCSKYCVANSPVPVVVVRPERKVRQSIQKRQADPKRMSYRSLLEAGKNAPLVKSPSQPATSPKSSADMQRLRTAPA